MKNKNQRLVSTRKAECKKRKIVARPAASQNLAPSPKLARCTCTVAVHHLNWITPLIIKIELFAFPIRQRARATQGSDEQPRPHRCGVGGGEQRTRGGTKQCSRGPAINIGSHRFYSRLHSHKIASRIMKKKM